MAEEGHKVTLNIYDLSQGMARQLSTAFLGKAIEGIWHTGIVVYGNEYYFGGGIQQDPVGRTPYGMPLRVVDLGVTHVPKDVFEMYLQEINPRYTAETYSLLSHNCNNFSNEVAQFLVGTTIPDYILQLPNEVMGTPRGALILPMIQQLETTMRSGAVPQAPQFSPAPFAQPSRPATTPSRPVAAVQANHSRSTAPSTIQSTGESTPKATTGESSIQNETPKTLENTIPPKTTLNVAGDPLGDARSRVQEEIGREFAAIMATGTLRASEAAALATRRVMQRYGHVDAAMPQVMLLTVRWPQKFRRHFMKMI